jgi:hypothetical protein
MMAFCKLGNEVPADVWPSGIDGANPGRREKLTVPTPMRPFFIFLLWAGILGLQRPVFPFFRQKIQA